MKPQTPPKPSRNYGIDLFRIVSMLMVVMLHITGTGGVSDCKMSFANNAVTWGTRSLTYCAVNCYALISGYVGIRSKQKLSSIADLWIRVLFYSVGISIIFYFTRPEVATLGTIFHSFFPVTNTQYWYFTAYFGMWFFIPLANTAVNNISKGKMFLILVGTSLILMVPNLFTDSLKLDGGYSPAWLFFLYVVGAYIGKYNVFEGVSRIKALIIYLCAVGVALGLKLALALDGWNFWGDMMFNYTSPTTLVSALSLLALFCNLKINPSFIKIVTFFSPLSFSVYLIHTHPLVFNHVFKDAFSFLATKSPIVLLLAIIGFTFAIYLVCVIIDYVRHLLFKVCKVRQILTWTENKLLIFARKIMAKIESTESKNDVKF